MKNFLLILFPAILLYSCSPDAKSDSTTEASTEIPIDLSNIEKQPDTLITQIVDTIKQEVDSSLNTPIPFLTIRLDNQHSSYREVAKNPVVLGDKAQVFFHPDSNSRVIESLPLLDSLKIKGTGRNKQGIWYLVSKKGVSGFIHARAVATHSYYQETENTSFSYLIARSYVPATIYKYDNFRKTFVDTLIVENSASHISEVTSVEWSNVNLVLKFIETRDYCGGGTYYTYIIDTPKKLAHLMNTGDYNDDGEYQDYSGSTIQFKKDTLLYHYDEVYSYDEESGDEEENEEDEEEDFNADEFKYYIQEYTDSIITYKWTGESLVKTSSKGSIRKERKKKEIDTETY